MSAPRTGTPFVSVSLVIAGVLAAAAVGCSRREAAGPIPQVTASKSGTAVAHAPGPAADR
jgi:hypothetical protein